MENGTCLWLLWAKWKGVSVGAYILIGHRLLKSLPKHWEKSKKRHLLGRLLRQKNKNSPNVKSAGYLSLQVLAIAGFTISNCSQMVKKRPAVLQIMRMLKNWFEKSYFNSIHLSVLIFPQLMISNESWNFEWKQEHENYFPLQIWSVP